MLRVLHNLSFIDDPTRIFRGIRYEARYGLRLDEHSARLARGAASRWGSSATFRTSRLRDELVRLLEDPGAAGRDPAARRARRRPGDPSAPQGRRGCRCACSRARVELRDELGVDVPAWRLGVAVLARELTLGRGIRLARAAEGAAARRRPDRRRDRRRARGSSSGFARSGSSRRRSSRSPTPFAPDAPLLALAREEQPELREYFVRLRDVRARDRRRTISSRSGSRSRHESGTILARAPPAEAERRARRTRRRSSRRRASSSTAERRRRDRRVRLGDRRAVRARPRRGRARGHGRRRHEVRVR